MTTRDGIDRCERQLPCNQHLTIVSSIFAFFVVVMLVLIGNVINNDNLSRERDTKIYEKVEMEFMDIAQRLTRIETKIETPGKFYGGG